MTTHSMVRRTTALVVLAGTLLIQGCSDDGDEATDTSDSVSYTHLRAHETVLDLVCRLLLEKKRRNTHGEGNPLDLYLSSCTNDGGTNGTRHACSPAYLRHSYP